MWIPRQFGQIVDRFRDDHRGDIWDEVLVALAVVIERGPFGAGSKIAKKLKGGGGIWELRARYKNQQPRLLFYIEGATLVFVHAWIKKGEHEYGQAINLAKQRRSAVLGGRARITALGGSQPH